MGRAGAWLFVLLALAVTGAAVYLFLGQDTAGSRGRREGLGQSDSEIRRDAPPESAPEERRVERTARAYPVLGEVRDEAGRPIPGATVRAVSPGGRGALEARTQASGAYEIELSAPVCAFDVFAEGYLPIVGVENGRSNGTQDLYCEGKGPWRRDFVLDAAATLGGRVLDGSMAPVPGARVYVISPEHAVLDADHVGTVARSDDAGFFRFPGLPAGTVDLGVRAQGFLPAMQRDVEVPASGALSHTFTLQRGRAVTVVVGNDTESTSVVAADSRLRGRLLPPGGLAALLDALVGRDFVALPVVSAARSEEYRLAGLPAGPADVQARDPDRITEPGLGSLIDTVEPRIELTLLSFVLVRVIPFDAVTREPLRPEITRSSGEGAPRHPVKEAEGGLEVPDDDRRHLLHFELEGYEPATLEMPAARQDRNVAFEVPMTPLAEAESGAFYLVFEEPFRGRLAVIGRDAEGRQGWVRHIEAPDENERWVVGSLPPGEYAVAVLATGKIPVDLPRVLVTRVSKETHRIRLSDGGGMEFKVTDASGKLLDKVHLLLKDAAERQIDLHIITHVSEGRAFLSINYVPTAATARADSGLAPGAYTLTAYREGFELGSAAFAVHGTDVAEVAIALSRR